MGLTAFSLINIVVQDNGFALSYRTYALNCIKPVYAYNRCFYIILHTVNQVTSYFCYSS